MKEIDRKHESSRVHLCSQVRISETQSKLLLRSDSLASQTRFVDTAYSSVCEELRRENLVGNIGATHENQTRLRKPRADSFSGDWVNLLLTSLSEYNLHFARQAHNRDTLRFATSTSTSNTKHSPKSNLQRFCILFAVLLPDYFAFRQRLATVCFPDCWFGGLANTLHNFKAVVTFVAAC